MVALKALDLYIKIYICLCYIHKLLMLPFSKNSESKRYTDIDCILFPCPFESNIIKVVRMFEVVTFLPLSRDR